MNKSNILIVCIWIIIIFILIYLLVSVNTSIIILIILLILYTTFSCLLLASITNEVIYAFIIFIIIIGGLIILFMIFISAISNEIELSNLRKNFLYLLIVALYYLFKRGHRMNYLNAVKISLNNNRNFNYLLNIYKIIDFPTLLLTIILIILLLLILILITKICTMNNKPLRRKIK